MFSTILLALTVQASTPDVVNSSNPVPVAAAATPASTQTAENKAGTKLVCRRYVRTGSFADFERKCRTKKDWDDLTTRTREEWRDVQGSKGNSKGN